MTAAGDSPPAEDGATGSAIVLAGSQGLGFASARALARAGWPVAVCARRQESLDRAVQGLRAEGGPGAVGIVADVSDEASVEDVVARATAELGPPAVLVANAGGPPAGGFDDLSTEQWGTGFRLTLMSFVWAVRAVLAPMRSRGSGRIVVIGSSSVRRPLPDLTLSNAFRPAVAGLVKDLSVTLAPDGITVNMVSPGRIDTERVRALDERRASAEGVDSATVRQRSERAIPMGRYGSPADLGAAVAYFASPEAAYVTGQSLLVDGGLVPTIP